MSTRFSLVCACLLAGAGSAGAQQVHHPELVTSRSVSVEPAPQAAVDSARTEWADHVMSKFFDDGPHEDEPAH